MKISPVSLNFKGYLRKNKTSNTNSTKAILSTFALGAGVLASVVFVKKAQDVSKLQKQIIEIYDAIYEDMAQESKKIGLDFIKPKLVFEQLPKKLNAVYTNGLNLISFNISELYSNRRVRFCDDTYLLEKLNNGKVVPYTNFTYSPKYDKRKDCVFVKGDEKLFSFASMLRHELTHARQDQIKISSPNALKRIYKENKAKNPEHFKGISFEHWLDVATFYKTYKPQTIFDSDHKFEFIFKSVVNQDGTPIKISYTPQDLINSMSGYTTKNPDRYFNNLMEIEAYLQEADFIANYKKFMPNIEIPKEVQEYYYNALVCACQTLLA